MHKGQGFMEELAYIWPARIADAFGAASSAELAKVDEIRIYANQPVMICKGNQDFFLGAGGALNASPRQALVATPEEITALFQSACQQSVYAYEHETKQGFLTLAGGYRLGLAGKVTVQEGKVMALTHCTGVCIRIMREVLGCADGILGFVSPAQQVLSTLIISPPIMGKTTLLRDLTRQISDGLLGLGGHRVCLIDERAELAGCVAGVPQLDVGLRTFVLDGCPKAVGMMMALRSLSPQVLVTDELGGEQDARAVMEAAFAGVKVLATVHGKDEHDLMQRQGMRYLLQERVFERYVVLGHAPGRIIKKLDQMLRPV